MTGPQPSDATELVEVDWYAAYMRVQAQASVYLARATAAEGTVERLTGAWSEVDRLAAANQRQFETITQLTRERDEAREGESRWLTRVHQIRYAAGVGAKPMLDELPDAIAARVAELEARATRAEALLETARKVLEPFANIAHALRSWPRLPSVSMKLSERDAGYLLLSLDAAASFLSSLSHQDEASGT